MQRGDYYLEYLERSTKHNPVYQSSNNTGAPLNYMPRGDVQSHEM